MPSQDPSDFADDATAPKPDADDVPATAAEPAFPLATTGKRGKSRSLKRRVTKRAIVDAQGVLVSRPQGVKFTRVEGDALYGYRPAMYDGVLFWTEDSAVGLFSITDIAVHLATLIPSLLAPAHEAVYINHDGTPFLTVTWEELRSRGRDGWTVTVVSVDSDVFSRVFVPRAAANNDVADALLRAAAEVIEKATVPVPPTGAFGKEAKRRQRGRAGQKGGAPGKLAKKPSKAQRKALPPGSGAGRA